jgi:para-aminobenzoate synthetase/4-amino-4-deoxychorismate lyase
MVVVTRRRMSGRPRCCAWDLSPRRYRERVRAVRARIAAGDFYVVNLTARLSGELASASPTEAFTVLAGRAEADMAALFEGLEGPTPWIASVSPERFVRIRRIEGGARSVEVCPIKGTRPRGATDAGDRALSTELLGDEKERAEHVMVVDMERNDLGVCCVPGSVHVDPLYEVVTTPYCHQLVSTVRGTLAPQAEFARVLGAAFPCGSVTGAPKRAAMRVIEELEAGPREAYCGALLVAVSGELDSAVLIRTLEGVDGEPGVARWGSGCGLTHDSDPAGEHLEMLLKASPVTGDGVPQVALRETMRVVSGCVPLLDLHLARLASGGCGPSVLARVRGAIADEARMAGEAPTRLGVTVTPDGAVAAGVSFEPSSLAVEGGPRLAPVEVQAAPALPLAAAKPAGRRYWDRAHRAAKLAGADQAALRLPDGTLIDGSTATLWIVREGELLTPPAPPAVAGVAREAVFDAAGIAGVEAAESALTLADLERADEVWLSNALGGFVPVRGRSGPVGERVTQAFWALFE